MNRPIVKKGRIYLLNFNKSAFLLQLATKDKNKNETIIFNFYYTYKHMHNKIHFFVHINKLSYTLLLNSVKEMLFIQKHLIVR